MRVFERGPCGAGEGLGWKRRRRGMRCAVAGCGLSGASGGAAALCSAGLARIRGMNLKISKQVITRLEVSIRLTLVIIHNSSVIGVFFDFL